MSVCRHGNLEHTCSICELYDDISELKERAERAERERDDLRNESLEISDALARAFRTGPPLSLRYTAMAAIDASRGAGVERISTLRFHLIEMIELAKAARATAFTDESERETNEKIVMALRAWRGDT